MQYFSSYIRDAHKCTQARPSHELSVTDVRLLPKLGRLEAFQYSYPVTNFTEIRAVVLAYLHPDIWVNRQTCQR